MDTALMCVICNDILKKTSIVRKALQESGIKFGTVVKLCNSLLVTSTKSENNFMYLRKLQNLSFQLVLTTLMPKKENEPENICR